MTYTAPTADQLQAKFPAFAAVADETIEVWIVDANRWVDSSWMEDDYQSAIMLATCHLMTLAGLGTGADAAANANGLAGYTSIRSAQLSLQRSASGRVDADGVPSPWNATGYGIQFYWLLKRNRPAVVTAVADGTQASVLRYAAQGE